MASDTVATEAIRGLQAQWSARAAELKREDCNAEAQVVMRYVTEQHEAVLQSNSETELRLRFRQLLSQLAHTCASYTEATLMVVSQRDEIAQERARLDEVRGENEALAAESRRNEQRCHNLEKELSTCSYNAP